MNIVLDQPLVSTQWLKAHSNTPNLVVLNASLPSVTDPKTIDKKQYIPGSRCFDIKNKFSDTSGRFPNTLPSEAQFVKEAQALGIQKDSAIVVYDDKGLYSSGRAWWLFKAFGHENVAVLDGGLPQWIADGYTTVSEYEPLEVTGDFEGELRAGYFKFFSDMEALASSGSCNILDARSEDRYLGTKEEPRAGLRSGHIPGSLNLPFRSLLDGYKMKSKAQLKSLFVALMLDQKPLVFSCGSGITACILALAAEQLGYKDLSIYDGSWTEYGSLT